METIKTEYLDKYFKEIQVSKPEGLLHARRKEGFDFFKRSGLPTRKNEDWKYTGISNLFTREYVVQLNGAPDTYAPIVKENQLPGSEAANKLVFVNGVYRPELSAIQADEQGLEIITLEEAATGKYAGLIEEHFGKSSLFIKDSIHALNTSLSSGGVLIFVKKGSEIKHPLYISQVFDTRQNHLLASPRSLIYVEQNAAVQIVESYHTSGAMDSFSNEVMEIVAEDDARVEIYKLQNDVPHAHHAGTTHIRQIGKCLVQTITISLDGGMIRNNTDIIMEKANNEAHMYGLYLLKGHTHVDNHTLVDNTQPGCFSNELYKGIIDDHATGIFSGKIYVRPDAQKTNAYQTNQNILLSETGTVNTKPQLEIFADDVKCSHGCTVGRLNEDALYYIQTRGISKDVARAILLHAFAMDIVNQIKIPSLKSYVDQLISERLQIETLVAAL